MKLKIIYRKNLKMSPGKIAAQAVHAAVGIGLRNEFMGVVVLGMSDTKFNELVEREEAHVVKDAGYTEVEPGTITCAAFYE